MLVRFMLDESPTSINLGNVYRFIIKEYSLRWFEADHLMLNLSDYEFIFSHFVFKLERQEC